MSFEISCLNVLTNFNQLLPVVTFLDVLAVNFLGNIPLPIPSMYGIFTYIWLFLLVNYGFHVGKYTSPMDASWVT